MGIDPQDGNNGSKDPLIPDTIGTGHWSDERVAARLPLEEEPTSYQLVGGVTAHQGDDG